MATMDLISWTLQKAQLLRSERHEPNNVDAIPSIDEFIALVKGDSFGLDCPKVPSAPTISNPADGNIVDFQPAIEAPLRDGSIALPEPNTFELPASTRLESSESAEELPAPVIDRSTSIQVTDVQLAVNAFVRDEATAKSDSFGLSIAIQTDTSTIPETQIEAVILRELHASDLPDTPQIATSTMVETPNEACSVPEPDASESRAIAQTELTNSEITNGASQPTQLTAIACVQLTVEPPVHCEAAGAPKSDEFELPLPVQPVPSQIATFAETPNETPRPALLMAITKADVHNTTPINRDRAIALRWTLRDIKGNRWKLSPISQDDLQTLSQLELVEIHNDVPVLTRAGLNAIA